MQVKEFLRKLPVFALPLVILGICFLFRNNLLSQRSVKIFLGFLFSVALALSLTPFEKNLKIITLPKSWTKFAPYAIAAFGFILYAIYGLIRFSHFQNPTWDFGLFDQIIWSLSRLQQSATSLLGVHFLGDHFSPILYLVVPIYWVYNSPISLILFEIVIVCFGALPIYWLAKKRFETNFLPITLCIAYIFYIGNQYAINFSFHPTTLFATLFLFAFYFFEERKYFWHWVFIALALMCREDVPLYIAAYGIFILFKKNWRGTVHIIIGGLWFFLTAKYFMPHFGNVPYARLGLGVMGSTPLKILVNFFLHPLFATSLFFNNPEKLLVFLSMFLSFGFLTLLTPSFWIILLPILAERFWTGGLILNMEFHYGAPISAILVLSAIFAVSYLKKQIRFPWEFFIGIFLLVNVCVMTYLLQTPIHNLVHKSFYITTPSMHSARKAIKLIPNQAAVAAQDDFVSHLSHRKVINLFPSKTDFILLDINAGTYPITKQEYYKYLKEILADPNYGIKFNEGSVILFEKGLQSNIKLAPEASNALNKN